MTSEHESRSNSKCAQVAFAQLTSALWELDDEDYLHVVAYEGSFFRTIASKTLETEYGIVTRFSRQPSSAERKHWMPLRARGENLA